VGALVLHLGGRAVRHTGALSAAVRPDALIPAFSLGEQDRRCAKCAPAAGCPHTGQGRAQPGALGCRVENCRHRQRYTVGADSDGALQGSYEFDSPGDGRVQSSLSSWGHRPEWRLPGSRPVVVHDEPGRLIVPLPRGGTGVGGGLVPGWNHPRPSAERGGWRRGALWTGLRGQAGGVGTRRRVGPADDRPLLFLGLPSARREARAGRPGRDGVYDPRTGRAHGARDRRAAGRIGWNQRGRRVARSCSGL
jgi:hypothetical protein